MIMQQHDGEARLAHAHVECRSGGRSWWRYARPFLSVDRVMFTLLGAIESTDETDYLVGPLGAPSDLSNETREEYTWRISGEYAADGDDRTVASGVADRWLASGRSRRWPTREPFERVTDPAFEQATWLDVRELDRVLRVYERETNDLVPSTYCAALAMMRELERDYEVRLVVWFERLAADLRGELQHPAPAEPIVRARRVV